MRLYQVLVAGVTVRGITQVVGARVWLSAQDAQALSSRVSPWRSAARSLAAIAQSHDRLLAQPCAACLSPNTQPARR